MSGLRPVPATLQTSTSADTPFGGSDETWTAAATLWVVLTIAAPLQELDGAEAAPAALDTASAVARDHPVADIGQRLLIDGDPDPWRVRRVDRAVPDQGRMTLRLDRLT